MMTAEVERLLGAQWLRNERSGGCMPLTDLNRYWPHTRTYEELLWLLTNKLLHVARASTTLWTDKLAYGWESAIRFAWGPTLGRGHRSAKCTHTTVTNLATIHPWSIHDSALPGSFQLWHPQEFRIFWLSPPLFTLKPDLDLINLDFPWNPFPPWVSTLQNKILPKMLRDSCLLATYGHGREIHKTFSAEFCSGE